MVVRVLRFRVPARHGRRVFDHARRLAGPAAPDGLLHVSVGRQQEGVSDSFILLTEWRDLESIYRWIGGNPLVSPTPSLGELSELATDIDIQHYEGPAEESDPQVRADERTAPDRPTRAADPRADTGSIASGISIEWRDASPAGSAGSLPA